MNNQVVKLNLRGHIFTTTRDTLLSSSQEGSGFFATLLEGAIGSALFDGAIFIDRDPTPFQTILTFLTTGYLEVPKDGGALRRLLCESDFYLLPVRDGLRRCGRCRQIYFAEGDPLPECACELHPGEYRQGPLEHTGSSLIRCLGEEYDHSPTTVPATSNHCMEAAKTRTAAAFCARCGHGECGRTRMSWREHQQQHGYQWAWSCCGDRRHDAPPCATGPHVPGPLSPPPSEPVPT